MTGLQQIVDLERYPIADLRRPEAQSLIEACRAQMSENGLCLLPNFVREEALAQMVEEAKRLLPSAHQTELAGDLSTLSSQKEPTRSTSRAGKNHPRKRASVRRCTLTRRAGYTNHQRSR
jgi:hypothetical protein